MKWISVKERLPNRNIDKVLFVCEGKNTEYDGPGPHLKNIYYGEFFKSREISHNGNIKTEENIWKEENSCCDDGEHNDISFWAEIEPPKDE